MSTTTGRAQRRASGLRVAVISTPCVPVPPRQYGGTELVVAELVDGLVEQGAEVTLFATGDSTGGFRHRCEVRALYETAVWPPSPTTELEHCAFALRSLLAEEHRFDVVHVHCPAFLSLAPLLDLPVVYTLHHKFEPDLCALYQAHPEATFAAISARQLELCGPFSRSAVVHHGIDPGRYHRPGEPRLDAVAFLGRLSEEKAPHVAVDVARAAGLRLTVGGRAHGGDQEYFRREVEWRLAQEHVDYLGEVSHEPKVQMLSTSRALLFPIDWEEPFGLVAIEAMLAGCPVIAFARGSVPEILDEGITGFIARDAEHMVELLRGPAAPERFDRERCRAHAARRFSTARMVDDYLDLYAAAMREARLREGTAATSASSDPW